MPDSKVNASELRHSSLFSLESFFTKTDSIKKFPNPNKYREASINRRTINKKLLTVDKVYGFLYINNWTIIEVNHLLAIKKTIWRIIFSANRPRGFCNSLTD